MEERGREKGTERMGIRSDGEEWKRRQEEGEKQERQRETTAGNETSRGARGRAAKPRFPLVIETATECEEGKKERGTKSGGESGSAQDGATLLKPPRRLAGG
jgi:hypothetical protein